MNPRLDRDIPQNDPFFLHSADGINIWRAGGNLMCNPDDPGAQAPGLR
ncbi:hypothetical protein [Rariglobus hedericola]|nr:hypothetical protein [Rariglobus hedericola]